MKLRSGSGEKPLWSQLYDILETEIMNEQYKMGDVLPSEKELMEQYQVSRVTVRQAMDKLITAGFISRSRGIGTIVIKNMSTVATSFQSSFHGVKETNNRKDRRVISVTYVIPPEEVTAYFGVDKEEYEQRMIKLTRETYVEGKPVIYYESYLNPILGLDLNVDLSGSMYKVLDDSGYRITAVKERITASLMSEQDKVIFGVSEDMVLMNRIRQGYCQDIPIEFTYSKYIAKGYELEIHLS